MTTMTTTTTSMTKHFTDLTAIHHLQDRYPFDETELEILVRCHEHIHHFRGDGTATAADKDGNDDDDDDSNNGFLMQLAMASPYSYFFVPGNEMRIRVTWMEDYILPAGFSNALRSAISADAFVEYANQGHEKSLERFLEGVADTGRRGTKEALRVIYNLLDQPQPAEIADFCVRLAVASDALTMAMLDPTAMLNKLQGMQVLIDMLAQSLHTFCKGQDPSIKQFVLWAEENFPMLSTPLSTFVHTLLFHGHPYPKARIPYHAPKLDKESDIASTSFDSWKLTALSFMAPELSGTWHRLYSSFYDGRSFNRMEWSILGYSGPTLFLLETTAGAILGGFADAAWKESKDFYGNNNCFLFSLYPHALQVFRPVTSSTAQKNFLYLNSQNVGSDPVKSGLLNGLGFGGTLSMPRLFIPEAFEDCTADFSDQTFQSGDLLPPEALQKFEIKCFEIWAVGGSPDVITKALEHRTEYRDMQATLLQNARAIHGAGPTK